MLSTFGVTAFADHDYDQVEDDGIVDECLEFGSQEVYGRIAARYPIADVATKRPKLLVEYATVVAARTLCMRRGNPAPQSLEIRYQEITATDGSLDKIASGKIRLIDSTGAQIAAVSGGAMAHANITIDRRFNKNQQRVIRSSSTVEPSTAMRRDSDLEISNG